jgi:hypothetical protein
MFFPMVDETDIYEKSGEQRDDINSLAEYIYQVLLGHRDSTPEDEDDDQAHFYQLKSGFFYSLTAQSISPISRKFSGHGISKILFLDFSERVPLPISRDIQDPPPDINCV